MPSLRPGLPPAWRAPRPSARRWPLALGLGLSLASASCESLFGGFATGNQDSCVVNAALCGPAEACNPSTKLCETAITVTAVDPPAGSNLGGTMVTLTGDRFVAGTTVLFDGVPATSVVVSSAQQLTAVAPPRPGRQGPIAIDLTSPAGVHVQKDKLFRYYGEITFQQQCFQGPSNAAIVVAADVNGDGKTDLVVTGGSIIRTYLSSNDGLTFTNKFDINPGLTVYTLIAADLNGDGKVDLALPVATATNAIATALGNGDGTFQALVNTPTTHAPYGLALADVNGDKRLDAVTLQNLDIVVQPGRGDGTFAAEQNTSYADQDSYSSSTTNLVDLDGDGLIDAVATNSTLQGFNVLFGKTGGWQAPLNKPLSNNPFSTFVSDYNQDGVLDIAVALSRAGTKVELFQGMSGQKFSPLTTLALGSNFRMQAQADFNGDGLADLVALNAGALNDNLVVYLGIGGGHFVALPAFSVPVAPVAAAVGDWNGDGQPDLVTISNAGDSVCVLRTAVK